MTHFASQLASTHKLASLRGKTASFDAVFYPGGAGPMWDLATDEDSIALIEEFVEADKPVASVCHGPVVLQGVKGPGGGWLVEGREVTGLSDEEEAFYDLEKYVPFSIEGRLKERGAKYVKAKELLGECVAVDGKLITGQNVTSAKAVGEALVRALGL
jgi:putative intracellular protease/amidase